MTDEQLGHIKRFVNNPPMMRAVFEAIRETFLKSKGARELVIMAAERISIDLLSEAARDLEKFQERKVEDKPVENRGL